MAENHLICGLQFSLASRCTEMGIPIQDLQGEVLVVAAYDVNEESTDQTPWGFAMLCRAREKREKKFKAKWWDFANEKTETSLKPLDKDSDVTLWPKDILSIVPCTIAVGKANWIQIPKDFNVDVSS
jgi:hypothetical protein